MRKLPRPLNKWLGFVLLMSMLFSGCISLAADVTPPPGNLQPTQIEETAVPTQQPTQEIQPTVESPDAESTEAGVVRVTVQDQTGGMLLESGLEVLLEGYDQFELIFQDSQLITTAELVQFSDVPFTSGRVFFASISYGGAVYRSEIFESEKGTTDLDLQVVIYETTTDDSGLFIDRVHVLLDFLQPEQIDVVEIYILSNLGNETIVAEVPGETSVVFPLPAEAIAIEFDDGVLGQRYLKTEDGFGDTISIPPGSGVYQVLVYYTLPYQRSRLVFEQEMKYPVGAVVVMTPAGDITVKGSSLEDMGVQSIPSGAVQVYSGSGLAKSEKLNFSVSGKLGNEISQEPKPQETSQGFFSRTVILIMGAVGLLLLVSGLWLFIQNSRKDRHDEGDPGPGQSREEILDSLVALEDLFQDGEISEKAFQQKRKRLKKKLENTVE
ncbi:MAG: hypothetical protein HQ574_06270 [Chloroflexi bacterium]|nr:hypothetical protein [Chloroflexota bacterium]